MKPRLQPIPEFGALLRQNFLAGLLIVIPFGVICWILGVMLGTLWQLQRVIPQDLQPDHFLPNPFLAVLVKLALTLGLALLLALGISMIGWASKHFFGQKILEFAGEIIERIPVVRSVYSALDQLLRTFASGSGTQQFNRVVYVEYPRRGLWTLAFVTGPSLGPAAPEGHLNIYVPTTPNPTSGFYLLVPETDVRESHLKVEDAFKTILSLGIAQAPSHSHPSKGTPHGS